MKKKAPPKLSQPRGSLWRLFSLLCFFLIGLTFQANIGMQSAISQGTQASLSSCSQLRPPSQRPPRLRPSKYQTGTIAPASTTVPKQIVDFEKQEGVVIAVKIHGTKPNIAQLKQSLCLLKAAYNARLQYEQIVFTTFALPQADAEELKQIVAPAKLTIVVDTKPLDQELELLTDKQRMKLVKRCFKNDISEITWYTKCHEEGHHLGNISLSYNWQAEFRSKHIWTHPVLEPYKYMLWFDSDALCTKVWEQDPIAFMIRHDLVMLFDNFPQGMTRGSAIHKRIHQAFNTSLCGIILQQGHLIPNLRQEPCNDAFLDQIHGFFHITNLDFYRSDQVLTWANILIGKEKYSRQFNDQVAVTVPAAILAPDRSWDMRENGLNFQVMHNGQFDGKEHFDRFTHGYKGRETWYLPWWELYGNKTFSEARDICLPLITNNG